MDTDGGPNGGTGLRQETRQSIHWDETRMWHRREEVSEAYEETRRYKIVSGSLESDRTQPYFFVLWTLGVPEVSAGCH